MGYNGIFITGTDTDIGKTIVSAAILSLLIKNGINAVPMKPIQTGAIKKGGNWLAPDLEFSLAMNEITVSPVKKRLMAPYCFSDPCSPHLASAIAHREIKISKIINAFNKLSQEYDSIIVEGAGGVLVPINREKTMLDIIVALRLPVILVARPGLGTLNHTLLSLRELKRAGIHTVGVIINATEPAQCERIEKDNIKTIERMGHTQILGKLPFMPELTKQKNKRAFTQTCTRELQKAALLTKLTK